MKAEFHVRNATGSDSKSYGSRTAMKWRLLDWVCCRNLVNTVKKCRCWGQVRSHLCLSIPVLIYHAGKVAGRLHANLSVERTIFFIAAWTVKC